MNRLETIIYDYNIDSVFRVYHKMGVGLSCPTLSGTFMFPKEGAHPSDKISV